MEQDLLGKIYFCISVWCHFRVFFPMFLLIEGILSSLQICRSLQCSFLSGSKLSANFKFSLISLKFQYLWKIMYQWASSFKSLDYGSSRAADTLRFLNSSWAASVQSNHFTHSSCIYKPQLSTQNNTAHIVDVNIMTKMTKGSFL